MKEEEIVRKYAEAKKVLDSVDDEVYSYFWGLLSGSGNRTQRQVFARIPESHARFRLWAEFLKGTGEVESFLPEGPITMVAAYGGAPPPGDYDGVNPSTIEVFLNVSPSLAKEMPLHRLKDRGAITVKEVKAIREHVVRRTTPYEEVSLHVERRAALLGLMEKYRPFQEEGVKVTFELRYGGQLAEELTYQGLKDKYAL